MKAFALVALAFVQAADQSPRALVNVARPLTTAEIAIVLAASRDAVAGKTLRLTSLFNGQGPELHIGSAGLPRAFRSVSTIIGGIVSVPAAAAQPVSTQWVEEVTTFIDYTGGAVRHCNGSIEPGEMVIEYVRRGAGRDWTATARRGEADDRGGPGFASAFGMLRGAGSVVSAEREQIRGRQARAFTATWVPPRGQALGPPIIRGDPLPNVIGERPPVDSIQSLWIDVESLLPLRWEVNKRGERSHGFDFAYMPIDLQPPAGVEAPSCLR